MKWLTQLSVILVVALMRAGALAAPAVTNLPDNRILLFDDYAASNTTVLLDQPWVLHDGPLYGIVPSQKALLTGTNHYHRSGWALYSCRGGTVGALSGGRYVPPFVVVPTYPLIASNLAANLRNDLASSLESPVLTNGIGTLYFEAINAFVGKPTELTVDLATNMWDQVGGTNVYTLLPSSTNGMISVWQTLSVSNLNQATSNDFIRYNNRLNVRTPAKVRIRRSGSVYAGILDDCFTVVDNVRVSPPPTDVTVYNPSAFNQGGNYTIRCYVSNADTNVPTDSRTVTAYYRWANLVPPANAWTNAAMSLMSAGDGFGNGERYELALPPQILGGNLEYYVVCAFGGYMYQSPDYTGKGYAGYQPESLSPFTMLVQTQYLAGADQYLLTVNSGSGSGAYTNGQQVAISASNVVGKTFVSWTGATQYVANAAAAATTVSMPNFDIAVTATYTNNAYTLTVNSGTGGGSYVYQQVVPISAAAQAGKIFVRWTGATQYVENVTLADTAVTMPASNIAVTATYADVHTLTVNGGAGGGSYTNGQQVSIAAAPPAPGTIFLRWTGATAYMANPAASNTVVTMPAADIAVTATYVNVYALTVTSGSGSGSYTNGQVVAIAANAPGPGKIFYRWTGSTANVADPAASNTVVTMPAAAVNLTATYLDVYTLTVNSGTGGGSAYTNGQVVAIAANAPALGKVFAFWSGATQFVADATASATAVTMPPSNIVVTATYSNAYYKLTVTGGSGSGSYTNAQVVAIAASVPVDKTFERWSGDTAYLAGGIVTSATTTVTMPAQNITIVAILSSQTSVLSEDRFLHFNDYLLTNAPNPVWTHDGPLIPGLELSKKALLAGTNHFHRTGWRLISCRAGTVGLYAGASYVPPFVPVPIYPSVASNLAANLRNDSGAMIESPVLTNGVGMIYFEAVNAFSGYPTEITVSVATNMVDVNMGTNSPTLLPQETADWKYDWKSVSVLQLAAATSNDFTRYNNRLNYRSQSKVRISRTGSIYPVVGQDYAFTVVDNVRVSPPPSDVVMTKTEAPFEPGFPGVGTNITVRCYVSNADMNVPTDSRTPKVVYRWRYLNQVIDAWRTNTMTYVAGTGDGQGNGEQYEANLSQSPFTQVGDLEYYFSCDFGGYVYLPPDYTGMKYTGYPPENLSPKLLRYDTEGKDFVIRIRPYASKYSKLYVVADTNLFANPIEMTVVGDNLWRGQVPIAGSGISNLVWRFKGEGEYVAGSGLISTNVTYWGGVSGVTAQRVPYGGMCGVTNESGLLSVLVDQGNYVFLSFNTETLEYLATRGEYQSFNLWPAPVNIFTESNGQDPKHSYLNTFNEWEVNKDRTFLQAFAGYPSTTNVFVRDPFLTFPPECAAGSAAYVSERTIADNTVNSPTNTLKFRNVAMRLKGGDGSLGLGYIHTRVATLPDGLKEINFKGRLGQTSDNYDVCYNRNGFTNLNYLVRATARGTSAVTMSPQNPSVSLVGYYRDADNFYEFRVTQVNDTRDTAGSIIDKTAKVELYKWLGGVATRLALGSNQTTTQSPLLDQTINDTYPLEMGFFNEAGGTRIRCRYANVDVINIVDSSSYLTSGSFGYLSSECRSGMSYVRTQGTITGAVGSGAETIWLRQDANFNADVANWFLPAGRYTANPDTTPKGIYSVTPTVQVGIYLQPTDYGTVEQPDGPGSSSWSLFKTVTVSGYAYQTSSIPANLWKSHFVMLQVLGGGADAVVDEFSVSSWHGQRNGLGWVDIMDWVAYESWVVTNATPEANTVYLDHTRGNPAEDQAIRSLVLTNGMGLMEFDYRVLRAPARLKVQFAPQRDVTDWRDVQSIDSPAATGWLHASAYLGTNAPGYFRLLNAREGVYTNALVEINNATVWDEPTITNNSWRAYNVKITSTDTNRVALDETKACFLNNNPYLEANPPQTVFQPFLRSPELPKGLGKLSFYARAYTNNQAATLFLYGSTNGWNAASNLWFEVTRFENITNSLYKLFTYEPADGRSFDAIQLGTKTRSTDKRVCVEDVAISEPVFPGFDIVNVQLMENPSGEDYTVYSQPLEGQEVHVQARIDNFQMTPSNIHMYVSYYVGTNHWGIGSWPAGDVVTRVMTNSVPGDPTLYRTVPKNLPGFPASATGGIVGQDRDQIVQYYVWAEYDGGVHLFEQQDIFVTPSWYYPIDLNAQYAHLGWSPYYYVYGVPPNSVWINEVNATDYVEENGDRKLGIWDNSYVEIAVPAWLDLAGWSLEVVQNDYTVRQILIPPGLPEQVAYTNGYAFFVIGDAAPPPAGVPALPKVDYAYPGLTTILPCIIPGGLRLKRPMGMYEQSSAYDFTNAWAGVYSGTNWAANDPQKRMKYVGMENNGGSLGVTNGAGLAFSDWTFPLPWSPGSPNLGQRVPNGDALLPGVSNILVTSSMNLPNGTQNGKRLSYYSLKMRKGMSTNIVYQTDPWYRLFSVKKDLVEQLPSLGTTNFFKLDLPDLQGDVGVNVDVRLREDISSQGLDSDVMNWILSFEDGELIPMYYNDRVLSLTEQYWLNANPTVSNTFHLAFTKMVLDPGTNYHLTVMMALNGEKKSSFQGQAVLKLQAKSRLLDSEWEMLAQYSLNADSFAADNTCRVFVSNPFDLVLEGVDPKTLFFRWLIELNDPRVAVQVLTNDTAP